MITEGSTPSQSSIPVSDINVVNGLSPLNWIVTGKYISSSSGGASLRIGFKNTHIVQLSVDTSVIKTPASRYPVLAWSVNDGPFQIHQLTPNEISVLLSFKETNPVIDIYLRGFSPFEDRYTGDVPGNVVKITGFLVEQGGQTVSTSLPEKIWLNIGDSIMSGDAAACQNKQGRPADDNWALSNEARASYGYLLAQHYGYRETRIASGGYNWGGGLGGFPGLDILIDQRTSTISRLTGDKLSPTPNVVLINLGENGVPAEAPVTSALAKIRRRVLPNTKLIVIIPVSGKGRAAITYAVDSYRKTSDDTNIYLVDLNKITFATADGQHPTAAGHKTIYDAARHFFDSISGLQNQAL